MKEGVYTK
jgi:hypothetical protein